MSAWFSKIVEFFSALFQTAREWVGELTGGNNWVRAGVAALMAYVLIGFCLAIYWSSEPDTFSVVGVSKNLVEGDKAKLVTGVYTTSALVNVVEVMLNKPGGYISNDISFPGLWMDNTPNWEYGVLIQVRDMTKALREAFSRSQSQSLENNNLARAESQFNFNNNSWLLPKTESEYEEGLKYLREYLLSLSDKSSTNTQFYARADNLRYWLSTVETRLGSLSQRLSASVGQRRLNTDLAGEAEAEQATDTPEEMLHKTPWFDIDDVFYESRGSTWALIHMLKGVERDFAAVLEKKNAKISLQQIVRELEATQQSIYSPVILNGGGFGVLANHSLVMASYISRANAAIIDLRELLSQG